MTAEIIIDHIIFLGGGLAIISAILQLMKNNRKLNNYLIFAFYLTLALILIHDYCIDNKLYYFLTGKRSFHVLYTLPSILLSSIIRLLEYLIGPIVLIFIRSVLNVDYKPSVKNCLHFFPALLIITVDIIIISIFWDRKPVRHSDFPLFQALVIGGRIHLICYMIYCIYQMHFLKLAKSSSIYSLKKSFNLIFIMITIILAVPSITAVIITLKPHIFINVSISLFIILLFIFEKTFPDFSIWMGLEIRKERYERTLLKGFDKELLAARINDLLDIEKIYHDDDLTIQKMAYKLSINAHQLSEYINSQYNKNFNSYINSFRIREAQEIISANQQVSILRIAYLVGFNSKSSFYNFFKKETGMTPMQYKDSITHSRQ